MVPFRFDAVATKLPLAPLHTARVLPAGVVIATVGVVLAATVVVLLAGLTLAQPLVV